MIYFIEDDGLVKIGFSKNPNKRFVALKTSNPHELIIRLVIDGTVDDERNFHKLFKEFHHRGEWYYFSDVIKNFIENNQKNDLRYDLGLLNNYKEIKTETGRIRNMLGMTLREVGEGMNITAQSVKEIEMREVMGTVSLNVLRKYASSLNHRLIYRFVKCDDDEIEEDREILEDNNC